MYLKVVSVLPVDHVKWIRKPMRPLLLSLATGVQSSPAFTNERSLNFSGMASALETPRRLGNGNANVEALPGEGDYLTFQLPEEPPKDKKKKKGKKGKKKGGKKKKKK